MSILESIKSNPFTPLKLVICGDGGVGKTTLVKTFINGSFFADANQTIAVAFHSTQMRISDPNSKVKLKVQIWDLGGQEQFRNMGMFKTYCKGADVALLCFDLTDIGSLYAIPHWLEFLEAETPKFLIGTKSDLATYEERKVDLSYYKSKFGCEEAYLCCSTHYQSIQEVFREVFQWLKEKQQEQFGILGVKIKQPKWMEIIPKLKE